MPNAPHTHTQVASGGLINGAAAFCTSSAPYAVSGTTKNVRAEEGGKLCVGETKGM